MKKNFIKTNSSYKGGCFNVGRGDMWGNYCPETGEYYLSRNLERFLEEEEEEDWWVQPTYSTARTLGYFI